MVSKQTKQFLKLTNKLDYRAQRKFFNRLSSNTKLQIYRSEKLCFFVDANKEGEPKEFYSPSSKYKLITQQYNTGPNTWLYCEGRIYDATDKLVAIVKRNYSDFPFCFIENHPNGNDYLVCEEDYQGQTILELNTRNRFDYIPIADNYKFGSFCWSGIKPSPNKTKLLVDGCYWACGYEYKLYDFSDPLTGAKPAKLFDKNNKEIYGEIVEAKWLEDSSCKMIIEYEWCISKNKNTHDLSDAEEEEVMNLIDNEHEPFSDHFSWKKEEIIYNFSL